MHPIIISLVDKKWSFFAYRVLRRRFLFTFTYLIIFLLTTISQRGEWDLNRNNEARIGLKVHRFANGLGHLIVVLGALWKITCEIIEMKTVGFQNYYGSSGSVFLENCMACSFCFSILFAQVLRLLDSQIETIVLAFASLLGWAYMLFFTMPFRFTGPFVIMIYKMLFNDVLRFCMIYIIFLLGFSQSFFILFRNEG